MSSSSSPSSSSRLLGGSAQQQRTMRRPSAIIFKTPPDVSSSSVGGSTAPSPKPTPEKVKRSGSVVVGGGSAGSSNSASTSLAAMLTSEGAMSTANVSMRAGAIAGAGGAAGAASSSGAISSVSPTCMGPYPSEIILLDGTHPIPFHGIRSSHHHHHHHHGHHEEHRHQHGADELAMILAPLYHDDDIAPFLVVGGTGDEGGGGACGGQKVTSTKHHVSSAFTSASKKLLMRMSESQQTARSSPATTKQQSGFDDNTRSNRHAANDQQVVKCVKVDAVLGNHGNDLGVKTGQRQVLQHLVESAATAIALEGNNVTFLHIGDGSDSHDVYCSLLPLVAARVFELQSNADSAVAGGTAVNTARSAADVNMVNITGQDFIDVLTVPPLQSEHVVPLSAVSSAMTSSAEMSEVPPYPGVHSSVTTPPVFLPAMSPVTPAATTPGASNDATRTLVYANLDSIDVPQQQQQRPDQGQLDEPTAKTAGTSAARRASSALSRLKNVAHRVGRAAGVVGAFSAAAAARRGSNTLDAGSFALATRGDRDVPLLDDDDGGDAPPGTTSGDTTKGGGNRRHSSALDSAGAGGGGSFRRRSSTTIGAVGPPRARSVVASRWQSAALGALVQKKKKEDEEQQQRPTSSTSGSDLDSPTAAQQFKQRTGHDDAPAAGADAGGLVEQHDGSSTTNPAPGFKPGFRFGLALGNSSKDSLADIDMHQSVSSSGAGSPPASGHATPDKRHKKAVGDHVHGNSPIPPLETPLNNNSMSPRAAGAASVSSARVSPVDKTSSTINNPLTADNAGRSSPQPQHRHQRSASALPPSAVALSPSAQAGPARIPSRSPTTRIPTGSDRFGGSPPSNGGGGSNHQPLKTKLRLRKHPELGCFVDGATSLVVSGVEDLMNVISGAVSQRLDAKNPINGVSHAVLKLKFQRAEVGNPVARTTSLTIVDVAVPLQDIRGGGAASSSTAGTVKISTPNSSNAASALSSAVGMNLRQAALPYVSLKRFAEVVSRDSARYRAFSHPSTSKATQQQQALLALGGGSLFDPDLHEYDPSRDAAALPRLVPSTSARTIRNSIKKDSMLTQYVGDDLDGNSLLKIFVPLPPTTDVETRIHDQVRTERCLGNAHFHSKRLMLADRLAHIATMLDPADNTKAVEVTTHALYVEIKNLKNILKNITAQKKDAGGGGAGSGVAPAGNSSQKQKQINLVQQEEEEMVRQMRTQLQNHQSRCESLESRVEEGKSGAEALKRRCDVQRQYLSVVNSRLKQRNVMMEQAEAFAKEIERLKAEKEEQKEKVVENKLLSRIASSKKRFEERDLRRMEDERTKNVELMESELKMQQHLNEIFFANSFRRVLYSARFSAAQKQLDAQLRDTKGTAAVLRARVEQKKKQICDLKDETSALHQLAVEYEREIDKVKSGEYVLAKEKEVDALRSVISLTKQQVAHLQSESSRVDSAVNELFDVFETRQLRSFPYFYDSRHSVLSKPPASPTMEKKKKTSSSTTVCGVSKSSSSEPPLVVSERQYHAGRVYRAELARAIREVETELHEVASVRMPQLQDTIMCRSDEFVELTSHHEYLASMLSVASPEVHALEEDTKEWVAKCDAAGEELELCTSQLAAVRRQAGSSSREYNVLCNVTAAKIVPIV